MIANLVSEICTVAGSGVATLTGAAPGALRFTEFLDGTSGIPVKIEQRNSLDVVVDWEFRYATVTGSTLSRDSVVRSSNNNLAVVFTGPCRASVFQPVEMLQAVETELSGAVRRSAPSWILGRIYDALGSVWIPLRRAITWFAPATGGAPETLRNPTTIPDGQTLVGWTLESPDPAIVGDLEYAVEVHANPGTTDHRNVIWEFRTVPVPGYPVPRVRWKHTQESAFGGAGALTQFEDYKSYAWGDLPLERVGIATVIQGNPVDNITDVLTAAAADRFVAQVPVGQFKGLQYFAVSREQMDFTALLSLTPESQPLGYDRMRWTHDQVGDDHTLRLTYTAINAAGDDVTPRSVFDIAGAQRFSIAGTYTEARQNVTPQERGLFAFRAISTTDTIAAVDAPFRAIFRDIANGQWSIKGDALGGTYVGTLPRVQVCDVATDGSVYDVFVAHALRSTIVDLLLVDTTVTAPPQRLPNAVCAYYNFTANNLVLQFLAAPAPAAGRYKLVVLAYA